MKILKFIKENTLGIKKNIVTTLWGIVGSILGTIILDLVNKLPAFSTILSFLDITITINLLLFLILIAHCLCFIVLFYRKNKKIKHYKKMYENYRQEYFPKGADSPLVRIEVKNSIEPYQYQAVINDLYEYIPAYKIARENNIIVAWITKKFEYKQIDEKLRQVQGVNRYVELSWIVVGV